VTCIKRFFTSVDKLDDAQFPTSWLFDQVAGADQTELRIPVSELRANYRSYAGRVGAPPQYGQGGEGSAA